MTIGVQNDATRLDEGRINNIIVNGGVARRAAVHRDTLSAGLQSWRQKLREENIGLRTVLDPDTPRFRSQFGEKYVDQQIPYIIGGLTYSRFALERVNMSNIPYDRRQADLAEFFMREEDMNFFAGQPSAPAGGSTGFANTGTVEGTNFAIAAATQLDLTSITTMVSTLATMIGEQADHFKERMAGYSLLLAVTPDVDDRINGFRDGTTGERMKPQMLGVLAENGNGGAAVLRTSWLGAIVDIGNGNTSYKITDGTTNAALMMWSETDPLYEVLSTGLIIDSGIDEVGNFNANFTQGYLPVSYDPYAINYSATVDITS